MFSKRLSRVFFSLLLGGFSLSIASAAEPPLPEVRAIQSSGPVAELSAGDSSVEAVAVETVEWTAELPRRLRAVAVGERLRVLDFPVSPGRRFTIDFERVDYYAPDAEIHVVDGARSRTVPRSNWRFFAGRSPERDVRALLVEKPVDRVLRATTWPTASSGRSSPRRAVEGSPTSCRRRRANGCGRGADADRNVRTGRRTARRIRRIRLRSREAAPRERGSAEALTSLHTATIAVDTDNELMNLKFTDNTTAATNYIANLFAAMNVFYERDVNLRLLQGVTFLRVSTTADPYSQAGTGSADGNKLGEFRNYWAAGCNGTCTSVPRALAMMLSGKQSSNFSASGIAGLGVTCSTCQRLQLQPGLQVRIKTLREATRDSSVTNSGTTSGRRTPTVFRTARRSTTATRAMGASRAQRVARRRRRSTACPT